MDQKIIEKRIEGMVQVKNLLPKWAIPFKTEVIQLMVIGYQTALTDNQNQDLDGVIDIS